MTRIKMTGAVAIALLAASVAACSRSGSEAAPAGETAARPAAAAVPQVTVAAPAAASLEATVEAPGSFIPMRRRASPPGAGTVTAVRIEEGSRVARASGGDNRPDEGGVERAAGRAMLAQAKANYERSKAIWPANRPSSTTRPSRPTSSTRSRPNTTRRPPGGCRRLRAPTGEAPAGGDDDHRALLRRRARQARLGRPAVREGDTLFVLMRVDPLKLQFDVPEKYADRLAARQEVHATVAALPGQEFTGTIQTVFPSVAVQSRTIRVDASVSNPGYRLKPGFYATVRVPLTRLPGSLVVPRSALVRHEGTENVFVVRGDRAELVRIQTGAETADRVEVVSGLSATDQVVVTGAETLRSGDRVQVKG
jgi:membrane fusion protein (multidrug efflux system)